ncbi:MAG: hypothetical protein M1380_08635 [Chloroflexi bacterium]|nr:hypothetical protein [Chloroflexota bacterium]
MPFRLEGSTRIDEGPVHVALREALVNLLVHADYAETQASLIKRSPEGYLFRNPGSSLVSEIDLFTGDRSDPRNPQLVRMFRYLGLAEEAGTGMPRILKAWRELGFRLPEIEVGTERYEFTLHLRHAHLLSDEDRVWLRSLGADWAEAEQLALVMAKHEGYVDNLGLRSLTGQHPTDVTKLLGSLRDRGLLQMIGWGRGARYELGPGGRFGPLFVIEGRAASTAAEDQASLMADVETRSEGIDRNSAGSERRSEGKAASSEGSVSNSEGMWAELTEISRTVREKSRLDPATRDDIVVRLCGRIPLSLNELTRLLGRNKAHVREILRLLVASGRLAYLYPGQPNHPRQKYVTAEIQTA